MAYIKKIWKDYPDATTPILASDMNNIENGIEAVDTALENIENNVNNIEDGLETVTNNVNNGWISLNGTFTYVSWYSSVRTGVVSSNLDLTPYLSDGMKIKFTQSGATKYAFITAITSTQLTLFLGTDYTLTNASISNVYYSMLKAPFGFPSDTSTWEITVSNTTATIQQTPEINVWYNLGGINISLPVGKWKVEYSIYQAGYRTTEGDVFNQTALSTELNAQTDNNLASVIFAGMVTDFGMNVYKYSYITLTTPTIYYLIAKTAVSGQKTLYWGGNRSATTIKAISAYL
jgi:hypothetical protein